MGLCPDIRPGHRSAAAHLTQHGELELRDGMAYKHSVAMLEKAQSLVCGQNARHFLCDICIRISPDLILNRSRSC